MTAPEPHTSPPPDSATPPWGGVAPSAPRTEPVEPPTFGELLADVLPVIGVVLVVPPAVIFLAGPWLLLGLMLSGPFALLVALAVVGLLATALVVTLAAVLAAPVVVVRRLVRRYRSSPAIGVAVPRVAAAPRAA